MSSVPRKAYLITLNGTNVCVIFSSGYHAELIKDEMRLCHFEEIYGITITAKSKTLEEQYEKEYSWDYVELDLITGADAERRAHKIMERAVNSLNTTEKQEK